ncbi:MAG: oligopeptide/dipeptide ABC transporter ATP-binding protein [Candidatus Thorarchaeota archaeon]
MILIDTIISILFLLFITKIVSRQIIEENQIEKSKKSLSINLSFSIVFIIILFLRYLFGILGYFIPFFQVFGSGLPISLDHIEFSFFAIMLTIFFPIFNLFIKKYNKDQNLDGKYRKILPSKIFTKRNILIISVGWIIAFIFLSIDILDIPIGHLIPPDPLNPTYDVFLMGFEWAFFAILIDISLTFLINKIRSVENRIPKEILNKSMIGAGIISFSIWSIQLVVVELYLKRLIGINLYEQDIRILIILTTGIYLGSFSALLKLKYIPEASERSKKDLQLAIQSEKIKDIQGLPDKVRKSILDVRDLSTYFHTEEGIVHAVEKVSFQIYEGEVLGLVGETGCGKSVTALSIFQLIYPPGNIESGSVFFGNVNLLGKSELEVLPYRGKDISIIFQDPLNSLNPVFKVGDQISEVYLLHQRNKLLIESSNNPGKSIYSVAREWSQKLLRELNIPAPQLIIDRYPHELSGGMRQRIQIAMALACNPKLLIADEPTTALDVTVQNQILKLMKDLKTRYNTSILFITHDLGIISKMCDRVAVMYSGSIVEYGEIKKLFIQPCHPYTRGLVNSIPVVGKKKEILDIIPGMVPNLIYPPSGCRFHPRCEYCFEPCNTDTPLNIEVEKNYYVRCHLYDPQFKDLAGRVVKEIDN